jgi:hypothetical protein
MAPLFFDEIVQSTKVALDVNTQLEKDADILTRHMERKVKQTIRNQASVGEMSAVIDLNTIHIDFASKYSVKQLLFNKITNSFVPISHRLFYESYTPFKEFAISEIDVNVFKVDWSHGLVKTEPVANILPYSNEHYGPIPVPTEAEVQEFLSMFPFLVASDIFPKA